ncbi:MAG TPA: hypothetical protein P5172_07950 [Syntrophales bacterium]|nr:hypothetical protein [Syntrophales bacterium]HQI36096.1 hypothetical protein [Syntrophales bacterium]HRU88868.1 hypothetical protein [Syntrophales bacterium]
MALYVTVTAVSVFTPGVTPITGDFTLVVPVGKPGGELGLPACFMTILTRRSCFYIVFGKITGTVTVHFLFAVAIDTHLSLLVMDIRTPPVFPRVFGINPAAVAEGAGLAFIFPDELVSFDESDPDAAYRRGLDMTTAAGGVAAPAGLLEHLVVEAFQFFRAKPLHDAVALPVGSIMKRFRVFIGYFSMAACTECDVVRRPLDKPLMGLLSGRGHIVALMAGRTTHGKMYILTDQSLVDQVSQIHLLRLNRRRSSRSPLPRSGIYDRGLVQRLEEFTVGMAGDTAFARSGKAGDGKNQQDNEGSR